MFTTSSNLKAHQRIHSDSRDFKCTQCDRAFKSASELNSHAGTHTGEKRHRCAECGKSFYKTSYLNVHYRTVHVGEKRHRCTECGKKFSNSSNLTCHYRIHSGEKPYTCKICGAAFNQSSALVRHSKQHNISKYAVRVILLIILINFIVFIFSSLKTISTDMKPTLSESASLMEPTTKVLPIDNEVVYHEASMDCQSIDPFTSYMKIPDSSSLIDSSTIIGISKNHPPYSFDVQSI